MKNQGFFEGSIEFPLSIELNFSKLIDVLEKGLRPSDATLTELIDRFRNHKSFEQLRNGITKLEQIEASSDQIDELMAFVFPKALTTNEIKAAAIPFSEILFYKTDRFKKILNAAGTEYELVTRNMDQDNAYIFACSLILIFHYGYMIDFKRPFLYDIPTEDGKIKNYRIVMNGEFMEIYPTERAIPITKEDVAELIDNFENVSIWKEKFPPQSYIFKGFGISNMFDVSIDEAISNIKASLLQQSEQSFTRLEENIRILFGNDTLNVGITLYDENTYSFNSIPHPDVKSIVLGKLISSLAKDAFCVHLNQEVIANQRLIAISDVEKYGQQTSQNQFYQHLKAQGYNSYMCAPLLDDGRVMGIMELGSPQFQFLNSINANKLEDVIPILSIVMRKAEEDHKNMLEVIIQEECTSIHPTVAWKFEEEAERFYRDRISNKEANFKEIVFEDVYPLYGQCDIRGSSDARNLAVKNDLVIQLAAAEKIIHSAREHKDLIIYRELVYRLDEFKSALNEGLAAGIDQQVLDFLKTDVYPVFSYLQNEDAELKLAIQEYMNMLNSDLKMVYQHRKNYDESVMIINKHLAVHLDHRAAEAQKMFPHFFERYKTDGVEFNMYIGQSLVKNHKFDRMYLNNLKLWQLTTMCELENQFNEIKPELGTPLEIASLILAYSTPLSIRFRMDEKQFDVDGAYNARYEIVKKRIDKAYIKGTSERLTQPGKIAIVYSQQNERLEYDKYAKYLKALGYIKDEVEYHILEDLQGISGLRAMRYTVKYTPLGTESPTSTTQASHKKISA